MRKIKRVIIIYILVNILTACNLYNTPKAERKVPVLENSGSNELWMTTPSKDQWMVPLHKKIIDKKSYDGIIDKKIIVNPEKKYQVMDGFGASLTESSTWLIQNKLTPEIRHKVMESLFGPSGIRLSLLRQPMGASDFSFVPWTYGDTPDNQDDFNLDKFSLKKEQDSIRPVLDMAMGIDPGRIKIIGSPWSPPAWMKTGRDLYGNIGGFLRSDVYETYARYFLRYLKGYESLGTPVYAITIQNEPKFAAPWPGMVMSYQEQINFINILGPLLEKNGYKDIKILAYDHNYDDISYAKAILNSSAKKYISGSAWHYYSSLAHKNLTTLHDQFPDKGHWLLEAGTGTWIGDGTDEEMFLDLMMHTIRFPRNWSKSYITWNVALDENSGPSLEGIDDSNLGLLTIRSDSMDKVKYNNTYYGLGHSSKFVHPGAFRIDSSPSEEWSLEQVSYLNPDGSVAVVFLNNMHKAICLEIEILNANKSFVIEIPARTGGTFIRKSN